jgi:hypothetical protein
VRLGINFQQRITVPRRVPHRLQRRKAQVGYLHMAALRFERKEQWQPAQEIEASSGTGNEDALRLFELVLDRLVQHEMQYGPIMT